MLGVEHSQYLGYVAALLTTSAFIPQVLLTIRTRDTNSISLGMYSIFFTGVVLWLIYGLLMEDNAIFYCNLITGALAFVILFMKLRASFKDKLNRRVKVEEMI